MVKCTRITHVRVNLSLLCPLPLPTTFTLSDTRSWNLTFPSIMTSLSEIDERIGAPERELRESRSLRNSHVRLCRLPAELFVKIVRECYSWKDLMTLNGLCRSIKQLTEGEPSLWSAPPLAHDGASDQLAELFIHRSGKTLLSFLRDGYYVDNQPYSAQQLSILMAQLHRTRKLQLVVGQAPDLGLFMETWFSVHNGGIEELSLSLSYELGGLAETVNFDLYGGHLQCLDSLHLRNMYFEGFLKAPSLQKLELHDITCDYESFRAGLSLMRCLKQLWISDVEMIYDGGPCKQDAIELPLLQQLKLRVDASDVMAILDRLPDPKMSFKIQILRLVEGVNHPGIQQAISRVAQFWKAATGQSTFECGECLCRMQVLVDGPDRTHCIQFGRDYNSGLRGNIPEIPEMMLHFLVYDLRATGTKPDILQAMSHLTDLTIEMDEDFGNTMHLHEHIDLDMFSGVERLVLSNKIDEKVVHSWPSHNALKELHTWIQSRKDAGAQLNSIVFRQCTSHLRSFFEELRDSQAAPEVQWEEEAAQVEN
jgi:hypothetical protein